VEIGNLQRFLSAPIIRAIIAEIENIPEDEGTTCEAKIKRLQERYNGESRQEGEGTTCEAETKRLQERYDGELRQEDEEEFKNYREELFGRLQRQLEKAKEGEDNLKKYRKDFLSRQERKLEKAKEDDETKADQAKTKRLQKRLLYRLQRELVDGLTNLYERPKLRRENSVVNLSTLQDESTWEPMPFEDYLSHIQPESNQRKFRNSRAEFAYLIFYLAPIFGLKRYDVDGCS